MSPRIPIVDVPAEYGEVGAEIEAAVLRVLRSGRYVLGPETEAFERELAGFVGTRHGVGVGSGTEALWLALRACGVGPGDEVITSALSFFATAEAILWTRRDAGVRRRRARRLPHGSRWARRAPLAAHARDRARASLRALRRHGAHPRLRRPLPASGRRGRRAGDRRGARRAPRRRGRPRGLLQLLPVEEPRRRGRRGRRRTDDDALAAALRSLRHHGAGPGGHERVGTTSRLDSLQAAVLRAKLPHLPRWLAQRAAHVARYRALLARVKDVRMPEAGADETPAWSQLVIRSEKAEDIRRALDAGDIEWRHHYPRPLYCEPAFGAGRLCPGTCPEAERACAESISIPLHPQLSPASIERVCEVIVEAVGA